MEHLLNLSFKLPKQIIPNIYRNISVVGNAVKDHLRKRNHLESHITNLTQYHPKLVPSLI